MKGDGFLAKLKTMMTLIQKEKKGGNFTDNRIYETIGDFKPDTLDECFRMLCADIAQVKLPTAKKKYKCTSKGSVSLSVIMNLCVDHDLAFDVDPIVGKFRVTHQAKGAAPILWGNDESEGEADSLTKVRANTEPRETGNIQENETVPKVLDNQQEMVDDTHREELKGGSMDAENNESVLEEKTNLLDENNVDTDEPLF